MYSEGASDLKGRPAVVWFSIFLVLASGWARGDDRIDRRMDEAVARLSTAGSSPTIVSLGNLTYADKQVGSSFSRYLQERLGSALTRNPNFELFARDRLEQILEAMELNLSDLVDQRDSIRIGAFEGVEGLLSGRFFDEDAAVRVFLELVEIETGLVRSKTSFALPRVWIPASLAIRPDNYADALFVLEELREILNADNKSFVVKAWTSRGDGGTYRDGEPLIVSFLASRDCYIKIYHIDVERKMKLIFPNRYYSNNFVNGKKIYRIPDSSYPFQFRLTRPYGAEIIKVIASTLQFKDIETSFEEIGTASRGAISRGLNVETKKSQVTEAMISYTIIE
jgi:hypothetical protein